MPLIVGNEKFSCQWASDVLIKILAVFEKLPSPAIHQQRSIPATSTSLFVEQRAGIYKNLSVDKGEAGEASTTPLSKPDIQTRHQPVKFLGSTGVESTFLVYFYNDAGDRLLIQWDDHPCPLETAINKFVDRNNINVIIVGGNSASPHSPAILQEILQKLFQLAQADDTTIIIQSQHTLARNRFKEGDKLAYYADFLLRNADMISKRFFNKPLPISTIHACRLENFKESETEDKKKSNAESVADLAVKFQPWILLLTSVQSRLYTPSLSQIWKQAIAKGRQPESLELEFQEVLRHIFSPAGYELLSLGSSFSGVMGTFTFPSTSIRHVGFDVNSHAIFQMTSLFDDREHKLFRQLRLVDLSWPDAPHIFCHSGESVAELILQPGWPGACSKIRATIQRNYGNHWSGYYEPAVIDFVIRMFHFRDVTSSKLALLSARKILDFVRFYYSTHPGCFDEVCLELKGDALKEVATSKKTTSKGPTPAPATSRAVPFLSEATQSLELQLRQAASEGKIGVVKYLASKKEVNVNAAGQKSGRTALHWAAMRGREACVKYLLQQHADVNVADKKGETPLHLAVANNKLGVVRQLLNADPKPTDTPQKPYGTLSIFSSGSVQCLDVDAYVSGDRQNAEYSYSAMPSSVPH